jgi:hypothetical protein
VLHLYNIIIDQYPTTRPTGTPPEMLADVLDIFMHGIES